jgi:hypothetical protein
MGGDAEFLFPNSNGPSLEVRANDFNRIGQVADFIGKKAELIRMGRGQIQDALISAATRIQSVKPSSREQEGEVDAQFFLMRDELFVSASAEISVLMDVNDRFVRERFCGAKHGFKPQRGEAGGSEKTAPGTRKTRRPLQIVLVGSAFHRGRFSRR